MHFVNTICLLKKMRRVMMQGEERERLEYLKMRRSLEVIACVLRFIVFVFVRTNYEGVL